jgi:hypothetical protein
MLLALPHLNGKRIFTYNTTDNAGCIFRRIRTRAFKKFNNPELKKLASIVADTGEQQKNAMQKATLTLCNIYWAIAHVHTFKSTHS